MDLQLQPLREINVADSFFDSLKAAYPEFPVWFNRKSAEGALAYVFHDEGGRVTDFLYLKIETEAVTDVMPVLPAKRRLKVGTFKLLSRGTRRGERFMKKIMDRAMAEDVDEVYVTIFPTAELEYLITFFGRFGFVKKAEKPHSTGASEVVLVKDMRAVEGDLLKDYPRMETSGRQKWLLAIKPEYHTKLFPDSILNNESYDMVQDLTPTNGIFKTYISWNADCLQMTRGDQVVIYRTTDDPARARYRSVATTVCTVDEVKSWGNFQDVEDFLDYTKYSVFSDAERRDWYHRRHGLVVIKMLYNVALSRRVIRQDLIEKAGLDERARWSLLPLTGEQFEEIYSLGGINERYYID